MSSSRRVAVLFVALVLVPAVQAAEIVLAGAVAPRRVALDPALGRWVDAEPLALGAEGEGGPTVVYDQTTLQLVNGSPVAVGYSHAFQTPCGPGMDVIDFDSGVLDSGGRNAIVFAELSYITKSPVPIAIALRLHVGTDTRAGTNGIPGEGVRVLIEGLPGSDDGTSTLVTAQVNLSARVGGPIVLEDGERVGYSYQFFDDLTSPLLVQAAPAPDMDGTQADTYNLDGTFSNSYSLDGFDTSLYLRLFGVAPEDISDGEESTRDATFIGRDAYTGLVSTTSDVDVFRYEAQDMEVGSITLVGEKDGDLTPRLEVVDLLGGSTILEVSSGSRTIKAPIIPFSTTGPHEVRVSGLDETTGSYRLKFRSRLANSLRRVEGSEPADDVGEGDEVSSVVDFVGKAGALLDLRIKPQSKVSGDLPVPQLLGPAGVVDLAGALTATGKGFRIRKLALPATGDYSLVPGEGTPVPLEAKGRVRPVPGRTRGDEQADVLRGAWVQEGFVTEGSGRRLYFDGRRGAVDNLSTSAAVGTLNEVATLRGVRVEPSFDPAQPEGLQVRYRLANLTIVSETPVTPQIVAGATVRVGFPPDGDPNRFVFESASLEERFIRDTALGPQAPTLEVETAEGGAAALTIGCVEDAVAFQVFRRVQGDPLEGVPPGTPFDALPEACGAPGATVTYFDALQTGGPFVYWVRGVDERGVPGAFGGPAVADD